MRHYIEELGEPRLRRISWCHKIKELTHGDEILGQLPWIQRGRSNRDSTHFKNPDINTDEKAEEDVRLFDKCGISRLGTDEEGLFKVVVWSPPEHLKHANLKYVNRTGYSLTKSFGKEVKFVLFSYDLNCLRHAINSSL